MGELGTVGIVNGRLNDTLPGFPPRILMTKGLSLSTSSNLTNEVAMTLF